jgi:RimJ/RimL family protein N-acetyltransferase
VAAYDLLRTEGRVNRRQGSGTRVSGDAVSRAAPGTTSAPALLHLLEPPDGVIQLACAAPDAPPPELTQAYQRILPELAAIEGDIGYHPAGHAVLRRAIAERYQRLGVPTRPEQIVVTNGGQQALSLLARLLVRPGDRVLVEAPTYPGALEALREAAATARPLPVGLDGFASAAAAHRPVLAYVISSGTCRRSAAARPCGCASAAATATLSPSRPCVRAWQSCRAAGSTRPARAGTICACTSWLRPATCAKPSSAWPGPGPPETGLPGGRAAWHTPTVSVEPAADFAVKPTLTGEKVVLRPFLLEQDFPALRKMLQDPEVLKLTGGGHGPGDLPEWDDATEAKIWDWYGSLNQQPDRLDLAVVDRASGRCVGEAVLNDWNPGNHSCNFRTALGPGSRARGLGTEATRMITGYGFERLGLHRIELEVYSFNPRARHVYEKVGYVAEGVLRDVLRWDGDWVDATVMSVLAPEWFRHRGHP